MSSTSNTLFVQYNVLLSSFNAPPAPPPPNYETRGKCTYMPNPLSLFQILFHGDQTGPAETGECLAPGCMPNCQPNGGKGTIINDATIILQIIIPSRISFQLSFITLHPWALAGNIFRGNWADAKRTPSYSSDLHFSVQSYKIRDLQNWVRLVL